VITLTLSRITKSAFSFVIVSKIFSRLFSESREIWLDLIPSLFALPQICSSVSSPETYITFQLIQDAICNARVDFQIHGSHDKSITLQAVIHHHKRLLSSSDKVNNFLALFSKSQIFFNSFLIHFKFHPLIFGSLNSVNVFHSLQKLH
jgi:hypothetical protein